MTIKELGIAATPIEEKDVVFNGHALKVKQNLTMNEKSVFIQFVVDSSMDEAVGISSDLRVKMSFMIAICRFFAGIDFDTTDFADIGYLIDSLQDSGLYHAIIDAIPEEVYNEMTDMVNQAVVEQNQYNMSAAGIIHAMASEEADMGKYIKGMLADIEDAKGLEQLAAIKDVVGTD